jgi:hypothetical protein
MKTFVLAATLFAGAAALAQSGAGLKDGPRNTLYPTNKDPLLASPLTKLPLGSVHAKGWLQKQLDLMKDGFSGHLSEISSFCKFDGNAWTHPRGEGQFGWEEVPYWLKGFVDLGYLTGDARILSESKRWIEAVLATQTPEGYFGSRTNLEDAAAGTKVLDLWPNMVMLYPLRSYYEATGDPRILPFMTKYFQWQMTLPLEKIYPGSWQKWRAGDNLDSIYWLYNRTGERWLLDLARVNHERTADWVGDIPTWHGVNLSECFREPGMYYQQTLDRRYLSASERVRATVMELYGQFPGGMFAADENARPGFSGPRQGAETCTMVELMHSYEMLLRITGESLWADRAEDVAFNSLPASMTPDLKGLHYLTAANVVELSRTNKAPMLDNGGDMLSYNPYQYRCCQHNVAFGWPYFVEHLWMATADNGLAAAIYAPSQVVAKVGAGVSVTIESTTAYPFEESVAFEIAPESPVRFPLSLRIPAWCAKPSLRVNGETVEVPAGARGWVTVDRTWKRGDQVTLLLPMEVRTKTWTGNRQAISVERGPLAYSLKIAERWQRYGGEANWPAYEVFASTPWNYGLSTNSFEVVPKQGPVAEQPFTPESAPVVIRTRGRRIPEWHLEPNGMVGELQEGVARTSEPEQTIELIPMGAARLRISAFPRVSNSSDAKSWDSNPPLPAASHAWHYYPPSAMNDGKVPRGSGDASIPWFVWWDTFGTREWAEYSFSAPRKVRWVEVYWADEEVQKGSERVPHDVRLQAPTDGRVRLPASWLLTWWDGTQWTPLKAEYPVGKDRFVRATFAPVTTTKLRLVAQLQPRNSAGILEWRLGE